MKRPRKKYRYESSSGDTSSIRKMERQPDWWVKEFRKAARRHMIKFVNSRINDETI